MKSPTLIEANPYLQDAGKRRRAILRSVATSSAIEGIRAPFRKPATKPKASKLATPGKLKHANPRPARGESARSPRGKAK